MNQKDQNVRGFAITCDEEGIIQDILRDDFDILQEQKLNNLFFTIVDRDSRSKALRFMADIQSDKVAFDYQMNVMMGEKLHTFSFIGILIENKILIIGAGDYQEAIEFTNFLQEVNNEQANMIRKLVKEKGQLKEQKQKKENELSLNDLSELNNELINLQREMSKKNSELARLNETKNRFLGMAAHDLRSPLSVIHSYSQYLMDKTKDVLPEKHIKFLETIYSTSQFMLSLIEDLLDISKIESGKMELNLEIFNLIELARKNIELNQALAEKKNIELNLDLNTKKLSVKADKHKIEQVFNNLLNNAIKFSYPGTSVNIKIIAEKDKVYIHIEDKGQGIPEGKKKTLFQPFQTQSSKGTDGERGTGLGLAISKRIIKEHGGDIWVESEQKKGSTFKFTLPNAFAEEKTHASSPYDWSDKTILLIEDDEANRLFIEKVLEPTHASVISCFDGNQGMQSYKDHPEIDLILLDLNLPGKSGFDIIREIRNENRKIPIIVQTAYAWSGDKQTAIVIGSSDYYTKPIDKDSFLSILKNYLN
jgi:signal transduction histidine kinase/CheY-like chemotaxis protein